MAGFGVKRHSDLKTNYATTFLLGSLQTVHCAYCTYIPHDLAILISIYGQNEIPRAFKRNCSYFKNMYPATQYKRYL